MNYLNNINSNLRNKNWQEFGLRTISCTTLTTVCAYSGTFFFTNIPPRIGAAYIGLCTLIGLIAYEIFEEAKIPIQSEPIKRVITVIQLLQFPLVFHLLGNRTYLAGALKLEILTATAYFVAIPVFFHFAIRALKDPTFNHICAAVGVMLPLASKLGDYAKTFSS